MTERRWLLGRDWWPEGTGRPLLRLIAGLLLGPAAATAAISPALWWLAASSGMPTEQVFGDAAILVLVSLTGLWVFSITLGLLAILALWTARLRGLISFAAAGFLAGVGLVAVNRVAGLGAEGSGGGSLAGAAAIGALCALSLLMTRWIAGIRRLAPDGSLAEDEDQPDDED